ncbi:MAG: hypothetical protein ISQ08_07850 [Planctomycetes bacterium]|nr:hypothetical protein [Planctomycetota bacterium]
MRAGVIVLGPLLASALLAGAGALSGCAAARAEQELRALPEHWDTLHPQEFAALALELTTAPWEGSARSELANLAAGRDEVSVRAVVLLAHDPSPDASAALLALLTRRQTAPARGLEGAEITAAAALADRPLLPGQVAELTELASQPAPHPTLDVRVECALAALQHGDATVAPFLIRVLRARTPAEREDPPDWEPIDTLAWPKHRAAAGLAAFLGTDDRFRPDGSWQHQVDEAARLEELLAQRPREADLERSDRQDPR